jgi:hypothetical protein
MKVVGLLFGLTTGIEAGVGVGLLTGNTLAALFLGIAFGVLTMAPFAAANLAQKD